MSDMSEKMDFAIAIDDLDKATKEHQEATLLASAARSREVTALNRESA